MWSLKEHYPHIEMISVGPTIRNAHSPDEKSGNRNSTNLLGFIDKSTCRYSCEVI